MVVPFAAFAVCVPLAAPEAAEPAGPIVIRVATFNIEDVRTDDLKNPAHPRVRRLAEIIQRLRPNVLLLNEIAYDQAGAPGHVAGEPDGQNAERFIRNFLSVAQASDVRPIDYRAFTAPSNTGLFSGLDLDNNGQAVNTYPEPPPAAADGTPGPQTDGGRLYGNDCWGFGTFPGQYAMALLVDPRLRILTDRVRTFRLMPWEFISGHFMPVAPDGTPWYDDAERPLVRLSSKSHWDVPVELPNGMVVHFLCSHPTPPVFDGPEDRNGRRNHDEIRFWRDYIDNNPSLVDDHNVAGGLPLREVVRDGVTSRFLSSFVILGDLNADPDAGNTFRNPVKTHLFSSRRVRGDFVPRADVATPGLEPHHTARFKLRADYVLPSRELRILAGGIWRTPPAGGETFPSDHFPVWLELEVPPPTPTPAPVPAPTPAPVPAPDPEADPSTSPPNEP